MIETPVTAAIDAYFEHDHTFVDPVCFTPLDAYDEMVTWNYVQWSKTDDSADRPSYQQIPIEYDLTIDEPRVLPSDVADVPPELAVMSDLPYHYAEQLVEDRLVEQEYRNDMRNTDVIRVSARIPVSVASVEYCFDPELVTADEVRCVIHGSSNRLTGAMDGAPVSEQQTALCTVWPYDVSLDDDECRLLRREPFETGVKFGGEYAVSDELLARDGPEASAQLVSDQHDDLVCSMIEEIAQLPGSESTVPIRRAIPIDDGEDGDRYEYERVGEQTTTYNGVIAIPPLLDG